MPTSREFVTQLQQAGVRASFVQPLIQYSHDGGMCWGQAGHNEGPLLAMSNREFGAPLNARADIPSDTPGVATLGGTSATYYDDSATAACPTTDVTSVSPVGSNRLFDATVLGFMGSARIGAQPATFAWATPQAGDVLPAFTNLSIPDRAATTASPLSLNLGGGATGAWSAARVVTPWASGQNYNPPYASGEATVSGRLFLERSPDLSANGLTALPEDLFNHQLQATSASGSVTVTATVPNGRYRPALYFADRQARTVNATVEGVSFDAVATGGAANAPATRVELGGTIDVTDGTLNVTLAPGSGAVRVAALEVVPAP